MLIENLFKVRNSDTMPDILNNVRNADRNVRSNECLNGERKDRDLKMLLIINKK